MTREKAEELFVKESIKVSAKYPKVLKAMISDEELMKQMRGFLNDMFPVMKQLESNIEDGRT